MAAGKRPFAGCGTLARQIFRIVVTAASKGMAVDQSDTISSVRWTFSHLVIHRQSRAAFTAKNQTRPTKIDVLFKNVVAMQVALENEELQIIQVPQVNRAEI